MPAGAGIRLLLACAIPIAVLVRTAALAEEDQAARVLNALRFKNKDADRTEEFVRQYIATFPPELKTLDNFVDAINGTTNTPATCCVERTSLRASVSSGK